MAAAVTRMPYRVPTMKSFRETLREGYHFLTPTKLYRPPVYWPTKTLADGIKQVGSHKARHADEEFARWSIKWWGTPRWFAKWFPNNQAEFGIGGGWADEHSDWIQTANGGWQYRYRKTGECCATLVLKKLKYQNRSLFDYVPFQNMVRFITSNDLTADSRPENWRRDLAHTINFLYDIVPNEELVGAWTMQAFDIWFAGHNCDPDNFTVDHFYKLAKGGLVNEVSSAARDEWLYSWDDWLEVANAAIAKTHDDFHLMDQLIKDLPASSTFTTTRYDGNPLKVAFVTETNRQVGAASRWNGYDVCVQLHSKHSPLADGLQVYRDRKRAAGPVDLRPIAYHLKRIAAHQERDRLPPQVQELDLDQWLLPGYAHPYDRCFFFVADETVASTDVPPGEGVFFKSLTAPKIPTPITPEQAIAVVTHCLTRPQKEAYTPLQ